MLGSNQRRLSRRFYRTLAPQTDSMGVQVGFMGVQVGFMGVQLGGKVIWAGLRGCGCGAGTAEQQREAVTVLPW